jgi:hypothetical protein
VDDRTPTTGAPVGRWPALSAIAVVVLTFSACGSSSSPGASATSKAADLALARKSLIVLGDLPSGWTQSGRVSSGSGSGNSLPTAKVAACLGVPRSEINTSWPTENSPTFNDAADESTVTDQVETFPNAAKAATDFSTFSNAKTPGCFQSVLGPLLRKDAQNGAGTGATVGTVTTTRRPFPAVGDESGDIEIQVPITTPSISTSLYVDLVVITEGRLETTLSLTSPGTPFGATLAQQVAAAAVRRMS